MKFFNVFIALKNALLYSLSGLNYLVKERAFSQEILLFLVVLALCTFSDASKIMKLYLFSSYILILITEALNSAIETIVNRIGTEYHHLSKKAKDIGSAAVFICLLHFFIIVLVFFL